MVSYKLVNPGVSNFSLVRSFFLRQNVLSSVPVGGAVSHMQISVGSGSRITDHCYINENC